MIRSQNGKQPSKFQREKISHVSRIYSINNVTVFNLVHQQNKKKHNFIVNFFTPNSHFYCYRPRQTLINWKCLVLITATEISNCVVLMGGHNTASISKHSLTLAVVFYQIHKQITTDFDLLWHNKENKIHFLKQPCR